MGYWGACSTYGSFSYLKYGMMRLFSQLAQDCELKVGKVIWVAGHSGPETAEDSRTHFGIFSPVVTQLFPEGHVINLRPWEHNEVAPALAAALKTDVPIIALHLTRPGVVIPDRGALGIPSHMEAAKGAYVLRDHDTTRPKAGTVIVEGTSTMESIIELLPRFHDGSRAEREDRRDLQLRALHAPAQGVPRLGPAQERLARLHGDLQRLADRHAPLALQQGRRAVRHDLDHDDRWRTGGSVAEVKVEARIDAESLFAGITRFANDREERLGRLSYTGE